eukprot:SAG31_NODE_1899_length_6960_cov_18.360880_4_plen_167_part_00
MSVAYGFCTLCGISRAGNFEELLLDSPRPDSDMPMHLPDAPPPKVPWTAPPKALPPPYPKSDIPACSPGMPGCPPDSASASGEHQDTRILQEDEPTDGVLPQHCGLQEATCNGLDVVNVRQRRYIKLYSKLTMTPEPNYEALDFQSAEKWLSDLYKQWVTQGSPTR